MEATQSPPTADARQHNLDATDGDVEADDVARHDAGDVISRSSSRSKHSPKDINVPKSRLQAGGVKRTGPGRKPRACK